MRETEIRHRNQRRIVGATALAVGVLGVGAATVVELSAYARRNEAPARESQRDRVLRNQQIDSRNQLALGLAIGAAAVVTTGIVFLLWPSAPSIVQQFDVATSSSGIEVGVRWHF